MVHDCSLSLSLSLSPLLSSSPNNPTFTFTGVVVLSYSTGFVSKWLTTLEVTNTWTYKLEGLIALRRRGKVATLALAPAAARLSLFVFGTRTKSTNSVRVPYQYQENTSREAENWRREKAICLVCVSQENLIGDKVLIKVKSLIHILFTM